VQQRLAFLPKQLPASADVDKATASATERTKRILQHSFWLTSKEVKSKCLTPRQVILRCLGCLKFPISSFFSGYAILSDWCRLAHERVDGKRKLG
jgi:hypothetical protein